MDRELYASTIVVDALEASSWERPRYEEWQRGGVTAVHVTCATWEGTRDALAEVGRWRRRIDENDDLIVLATSGADIRRAKSQAKTAVILGFQNASPVADDPALLYAFRSLGIRIMQLTYNAANGLGGSCYDDPDPGLSEHGRGAHPGDESSRYPR